MRKWNLFIYNNIGTKLHLGYDLDSAQISWRPTADWRCLANGRVAAQACVRRLWAVAWVVGRLLLVTRERIRGGWSTRCAIQIDVLPYLAFISMTLLGRCHLYFLPNETNLLPVLCWLCSSVLSLVNLVFSLELSIQCLLWYMPVIHSYYIYMIMQLHYYYYYYYYMLLLLSEHLYSALSLNKIPNALHALCQYVANRKHLSEC